MPGFVFSLKRRAPLSSALLLVVVLRQLGLEVDELLELFRRDRKWNEEAARTQLVKFFEAWGPKEPATLYGRRRLSSVLFS